jgi:hypothetical protein
MLHTTPITSLFLIQWELKNQIRHDKWKKMKWNDQMQRLFSKFWLNEEEYFPKLFQTDYFEIIVCISVTLQFDGFSCE